MPPKCPTCGRPYEAFRLTDADGRAVERYGCPLHNQAKSAEPSKTEKTPAK